MLYIWINIKFTLLVFLLTKDDSTFIPLSYGEVQLMCNQPDMLFFCIEQ